MIVLSQTTDKIQVVLAASVAANQAQCVASWRDITAAPTYTPGRSVANTNNTTDVDFIPSPAASTQRVIDFINIYNNDTASITVTVKYDANGTDYILENETLASGERLEYENGKGWNKVGGATPGGSNGQVQFNNANVLGGATNVSITSGNLHLNSTSDPSSPSGGVLLYSKSIAGRHIPKIIGPSGIDTILQVGLSGNAVFMVSPASTTTAPSVWGGTLTTAATMSAPQTIASANIWQATWRKRFQTTTTAGNATGMRTAYTQWFRGDAAGFGGFFFRAQLGQNINLNGAQCFVGLCASTAVLASTAGAVGALLNMIGMGYDTTDASTGNWQLFRNDGTGTATKVDLGASAARNTTHGFDLIIFCPPGAATEIFVRIVNLHSNTVVLDTSYTTDLPAVNTGMAFKSECNNGAVAAATNIEIAKVYIETDY